MKNILLSLALIAGASSAHGATVDVDPFVRGCISEAGASACGDGSGPPTLNAITNYQASINQNSDERRSVFLFDLSGVTGSILGGTLSFELSSVPINSPEGIETMGFFALNDTSEAALEADAPTVDVFTDAGSGTQIGALDVTNSDGNSTISMNLTADFLSALNAEVGGVFGLGGAIVTGQGGVVTERIFNSSQNRTVTLSLTTDGQPPAIPLPAGLPLILAGLGAFGLVKRRKARR